MNIEKLNDPIRKLCESLAGLWSIEEFKVRTSYSYNKRRKCITHLPGEESENKSAGPFIRGNGLAEVKRIEHEGSNLENIKKIVWNSYTEEADERDSDKKKNAHKKAKNAADSLLAILAKDVSLSYRLREAIGYKSMSFEDFEKHAKTSSDEHLSFRFYSLSELLAVELEKEGFRTTARTEFDRWDAVIKNTVTELIDLKNREHYKYEVCIFVNGPFLNTYDRNHIASLELGSTSFEVSIGYATDDDLSELINNYNDVEVEEINVVIKYMIDIPVEKPESEYISSYSGGSEVAKYLLHALRILRPKDDIGVLALAVYSRDSMAPSIRNTWHNSYHRELAGFVAKRFNYPLMNIEPFSIDEINKLKKLIPEILPNSEKGNFLAHVLDRFSGSIERYFPDDPERLLEYSIALESLYLSDGGTSELTYRLAIRASRFLDEDIDKRKEIFKIITDLYKFRSKIAHGVDIKNDIKMKEKIILTETLNKMPDIFSNTVLKLIDDLPRISKKAKEETLKEFWKNIELG